MNEPPILSEPLTVSEVAIFLGQDRKAARKFIAAVGGTECGSLWQIPIDRMPFSYRTARAMGQCGPMWANVAELETDQHEFDNRAKLEDMNRLLTERDAAIQLRVSLDDLNALLESGELAYVSVGGEVRICADDMQRMIRKTKTETALPERRRNECRL